MDEASLCDRMALMQSGKFLTIDSPSGIIKSFGRKLFAVRSGSMYDLLKKIRSLQSVKSCHAFGDMHHVTLHDENANAGYLRNQCASFGHNDAEVHEIPATIEDCFMSLSVS